MWAGTRATERKTELCTRRRASKQKTPLWAGTRETEHGRDFCTGTRGSKQKTPLGQEQEKLNMREIFAQEQEVVNKRHLCGQEQVQEREGANLVNGGPQQLQQSVSFLFFLR